MEPPADTRRRVLLISQDIVGEAMAGPGVRYFHLARALAPHVDVTLAVPEGSSPGPGPGLRMLPYTRGEWASLEPLVQACDVAVFPNGTATDFPRLLDAAACLVLDGYDPLLAEWLAITGSFGPDGQHLHWWPRMRDLNRQYLAADFVICASERQRDWWLGLLEANGRVNAYTYAEDRSLRRLVDVVPIGVPATSPVHTRPAVKGVLPGIGPRDRLILWGGGLWPWLDPVTAVRGVARLAVRRPDLRLLLPGVDHPSPWMKGIPTQLEAARQAAAEAGLLDRAVFFADWVPYADWPNVLLESDVAVSLAHDTLETRLAFRTRIVDCVWAGLPVVTTAGDVTAEMVAAYGLGAVVEPGDVDGVADALDRLLDTPRDGFGEPFERARRALAWDAAARPLINFCLHPRRAPDKLAIGEQLGSPYWLDKIHGLQHQADVLRVDSEQWRAESAGLRQEIDRLRQELDRLRQENAYLRREIDAWRERYERQWFVRLRHRGYRTLQALSSRVRRTPRAPGGGPAAP